ncbi:hypothetical protein [Streptomyces sp. NPDC052042]|uniref:hypothetical protein n=1 Tax=Streptomyces sp. NPDC052042 TaxID=3365683 RepID=UPI0037D92033
MTGALAGAVYGYGALPVRRTGPPHVPPSGYGTDGVRRTAALVAPAERRDGSSPGTRSDSPGAHPPQNYT